MKKYERLSMEVVKLNNEDVLTASGELTVEKICKNPGVFDENGCNDACKNGGIQTNPFCWGFINQMK